MLTDCPVTFVKPIGGYGFGIAAAEFIAANVPKGGKVLALRILPGVDVLETRWAAAKRIFDENGHQRGRRRVHRRRPRQDQVDRRGLP